MYYGWISGEYEDRNILYSLGISFSNYSYSAKLFHDCEVPAKAIKELSKYNGKFHWGLDRIGDGGNYVEVAR